MASSFQQKRYITVDDLGFPDVDVIESEYTYRQNIVHNIGSTPIIRPSCASIQFNTVAKPKKTGVMVVGLGGNNGSTFTGALIANKNGLTWETKRGTEKSNYFGSVTQASTAHVGTTPHGQQVYTPLHKLVPMLDPNELCVGGWDINGENLANAMSRAEVYPIDLQRQLRPLMEGIVPLPGIYYPHFIAGNQENRANNTLDGDHACMAHVEKLRADIRDFKEKNGLDAVILLGSANTERFAEIRSGLNTTADELLESIEDGNPEVSPSTVYAVAGALEGCAYINGSPQNTFVPGMIELAQREGIFIAGDDFKSGQTKIKSVLVDFLISAGIKVESIVSYNHLGNNDGKNLNEPKQFRSKEISKSNVVDDMVEKNSIVYEDGEHPDHIVVIKYCPFVKDSKRAMDEYTTIAFSLNSDFEGNLKVKIIEYNTSGNDKITRIQDSLDSTKNIMVQNIETVLNRGEKLEVLVEKAEDLNDTSMTFRHNVDYPKKKWRVYYLDDESPIPPRPRDVLDAEEYHEYMRPSELKWWHTHLFPGMYKGDGT